MEQLKPKTIIAFLLSKGWEIDNVDIKYGGTYVLNPPEELGIEDKDFRYLPSGVISQLVTSDLNLK